MKQKLYAKHKSSINGIPTKNFPISIEKSCSRLLIVSIENSIRLLNNSDTSYIQVCMISELQYLYTSKQRVLENLLLFVIKQSKIPSVIVIELEKVL